MLWLPMCDPKMDLICPKITQNVRPNCCFNEVHASNIYIYNSIASSLSGRFWSRNRLKRPWSANMGKLCNHIIWPDLFSMVKNALKTIRHIIEYAAWHIPVWGALATIVHEQDRTYNHSWAGAYWKWAGPYTQSFMHEQEHTYNYSCIQSFMHTNIDAYIHTYIQSWAGP